MKVSPVIGRGVAGLVRVTIHFYGDDGEKDLREPISVIVKDDGGSVMVNRAAYIKAREGLAESETELHQLLTAAISE